MDWLLPWHSIADDSNEVTGMERELRRELSAGHPLYGLPVRAMARRQDCDDVLFALADGTGRVAVVHLTWTHSPPEAPPWPVTVVYPTIERWAEQVMKPDHDEFCHGTGGVEP